MRYKSGYVTYVQPQVSVKVDIRQEAQRLGKWRAFKARQGLIVRARSRVHVCTHEKATGKNQRQEKSDRGHWLVA